MTDYDGIVLAGGAGRRLGGIAKPTLEVRGRRLLDVAIDALSGAARIVAVGPPVPTRTAVRWTREDPVGGGPVAALGAALAEVSASIVVVLAADLPFVTGTAVAGLVAATASRRSAVAVDDEGRDQPLLACYPTDSLRAALPAEPQSGSMRALLAAVERSAPARRLRLDGTPPPWRDCDTPEQLAAARRTASSRD